MTRVITARSSEAELQSAVRQMCDSLGLAVDHKENPLRDWLSGWPDLWIAGPGGIYYRELKDARGVLSDKQKRVRRVIEQAGGNWALWRPADYVCGRIADELIAISAMPAARYIAARLQGATP